MMDEQRPISDDPAAGISEIGSAGGEAQAGAIHSQAVSQADESASHFPDHSQPSSPVGTAWGERLRRWLGISREIYTERLSELNRAIAMYPDAAVNYVLRGELYAKLGENALAQADFQRGLELAEARLEASNWGFMAQTLRDRALMGLQQVEGRLR
jgi:tetratricopeptide (TPR) repeat protein